MPIKKIGSLQIESEAAIFNPLFWRIQKLIIIFLILFLIATFLGLTGNGLLDRVTLTHPNNTLAISYNKFARKNANNDLKIYYTLSNTNTSLFTVSISSAYLLPQFIKQITPQPLISELSNHQITYVFKSNGRTGIIEFVLEPQQTGILKADISTNNETNISINQFILP